MDSYPGVNIATDRLNDLSIAVKQLEAGMAAKMDA